MCGVGRCKALSLFLLVEITVTAFTQRQAFGFPLVFESGGGSPLRGGVHFFKLLSQLVRVCVALNEILFGIRSEFSKTIRVGERDCGSFVCRIMPD